MTTTITDAASLERQRQLYDFVLLAVHERQRNVYAAQAAGRWDLVEIEADLLAIAQGAAFRVRMRILAADPTYCFPMATPEPYQEYSPPAHVETTTEAACWLMRLSDWWAAQPSELLLDWGSRLVRLRAACWRGWFGRG